MNEGSDKSRKTGHEAIFQRHSKAQYLNDARVSASDDPTADVVKEDQLWPDLSEAGVELANKSARELLSTFDPEHDKIFIVSSHFVRALETAKIYADVAKEMGIQVIRPDNVRGELASEIAGGDVRVLSELSIKDESMAVANLFNPTDGMYPINWDAVDPLLKEKWDEARKIVLADDKGSWGANFFAHSEEIKEMYPDFTMRTTFDLYNQQFTKLARLAEWGIKKAQEKDPGGSIKILAFGHENYLSYALSKYFKEHTVPNCEPMTLLIDDAEHMTLTKGDTTVRIE